MDSGDRKAKHQQELKIAADLAVGADSKLEGLPESSREFLSAALGVHAKNWFNLLDQVRRLRDFDSVKQKLDGLALDFLKEYLERVFGALPEDFNVVLQKSTRWCCNTRTWKTLPSRSSTGTTAKLDVLVARLSELERLPSWDKLPGDVDRETWDILRQLTDGNPLELDHGQGEAPRFGSIRSPSLDKMKELARKALAFDPGQGTRRDSRTDRSREGKFSARSLLPASGGGRHRRRAESAG